MILVATNLYKQPPTLNIEIGITVRIQHKYKSRTVIFIYFWAIYVVIWTRLQSYKSSIFICHLRINISTKIVN